MTLRHGSQSLRRLTAGTDEFVGNNSAEKADKPSSDPVGSLAGFDSSPTTPGPSEPVGTLAGCADASPTYRATVSRSTPSSRAIRR